MRILVTGASGQLGQDIVTKFEQQNFEVLGCPRSELDVTNQDDVLQTVEKFRPNIIIHAAAYTNVNQAELDIDRAYRVNSIGTQNVALAADKIGAKICYISTDYVFDGCKRTPYTESDVPNPINVYGKSKYEGEIAIRKLCKQYFIVRTSWLYGVHGNNFVKTMLQLSQRGEEIRVVDDQVGSPTYSEDLVCFLAELVITDKFGTYHASNSGSCSWYEFANAIFEISEINIKVQTVPSSDYPSVARRPSYSVLAHDAILINGFTPLPEWKDGLKRFLNKFQRIDFDDH